MKYPFRLAINVLLVTLVSLIVCHPSSVALAFVLTAVPVPVPVVGVRKLGVISSSLLNNANYNGVASSSLSASVKKDEEQDIKNDDGNSIFTDKASIMINFEFPIV